jgi:hypothetical protein
MTATDGPQSLGGEGADSQDLKDSDPSEALFDVEGLWRIDLSGIGMAVDLRLGGSVDWTTTSVTPQ